jgi:hypothetical protein
MIGRREFIMLLAAGAAVMNDSRALAKNKTPRGAGLE